MFYDILTLISTIKMKIFNTLFKNIDEYIYNIFIVRIFQQKSLYCSNYNWKPKNYFSFTVCVQL